MDFSIYILVRDIIVPKDNNIKRTKTFRVRIFLFICNDGAGLAMA
jgi:hypothetical protein